MNLKTNIMKQITQVENISGDDFKNEMNAVSNEVRHISEVLKDFMQDMKSKQNREFITSKEASGILKVTLPTLYDWRKKGIITAYRIGNKVRFIREELEHSLIKIDSAS
jgi:excisionase family DNA binding protein